MGKFELSLDATGHGQVLLNGTPVAGVIGVEFHAFANKGTKLVIHLTNYDGKIIAENVGVEIRTISTNKSVQRFDYVPSPPDDPDGIIKKGL